MFNTNILSTHQNRRTMKKNSFINHLANFNQTQHDIWWKIIKDKIIDQEWSSLFVVRNWYLGELCSPCLSFGVIILTSFNDFLQENVPSEFTQDDLEHEMALEKEKLPQIPTYTETGM